MTAPSTDESRLRLLARENAIETLMDMHPNGALYRANRSLERTTSILDARYNRIPDWVLLDHANSLSNYEISSEALLMDLRESSLSSSSSTIDSRMTRLLQYQQRILEIKHPESSSFLVPPPRLISILRQIFESPSTEDLSSMETHQVNVLPSLLHSIVNHSIFSVSSATVSPQWKHVTTTTSTVPQVANLEAILANLCKDLSKEDDTTNIQGLLLASLSLLTTYLLEEDHGWTTTLLPSSLETNTIHIHSPTTGTISPNLYLQVGGLLTLLDRYPPKKDIVPSCTFQLDPSWIQYFAEASSIYEERMELQTQDEGTLPTTRIHMDDDHPDSKERILEEGPSSENSNQEMSHATRMLLSTILGGEDRFPFDRDPPRDEQDPESSHDPDENSEATRDYSSQETTVAVNEENQEEVTTSNPVEEMLQRALELSLATTGESDSEEDKKQSTLQIPLNHEFKKEEDKNSDGSIGTDVGSEPKSANLPPFPTPPSLDNLRHTFWNDDLSDDQVASLLDPSAVSTFGNVPASCVLVQLFQTLLGIMEGHIDNSNTKDNDSVPAIPTNTVESSNKKLLSNRKMFNVDEAKNETECMKQEQRDFVPDSVTVQLLIASLHLSSYLRNYSISVLHKILSEKEEALSRDKQFEEEQEEESKDETLQIADSIESEDPLEEDPVLLVVASETALENKGFERKSAAAADLSMLRHTTKQNMAKLWVDRASFYSICCFINMRCLRIFMAKCTQHGIRFSDVTDSDCGDTIYMSSKSRNGLAKILSSFHDVSLTTTFQSLQNSMDAIFAGNAEHSKSLFVELLASSLCNESLSLWGASIPFIYPQQSDRLDILKELVLKGLSAPSVKPPTNSDWKSMLMSGDWDIIDNIKLDLLCRRLRMSDMLNGFLPQPKHMYDCSDSVLDIEMLNLSISTLKWLGKVLSPTLPHVSQLYYALCSRAISSLILWNDLALSPTERTGQDVSMKIELNPNKLQFDPSKCADSIAIETPNVTANQRAAKVWGTVLSTTSFLPKTGIHRFAVKLDKCERGHIFVGVATSRANTKTYIGGDKNGWGFIGTQALWHDRNKIRSDYGSVLRSGAVVVVTLDTDLGTLSFGLWKDASDLETCTGPMSPSMASLASPRRSSCVGGEPIIEDWGIAFEGLPLDAKLYPAVGLYQRDDRATLHVITSSSESTMKSRMSPSISSGQVYYPLEETIADHATQIRSWNQALCQSGISFARDILMASIEILSSEIDAESSLIVSVLLPRLASALCLIPSCIPTLSAKYATELLPFVSQCVKKLDCTAKLPESTNSFNIEMKEGPWLVEVYESSSSDFNVEGEYIVEILQKAVENDDNVSMCLHGKGTNSSGNISLIGAIRGTNIQFVEILSERGFIPDNCSSNNDAPRALIDSRLSLDGSRFEGSYVNIEHNITAKVTGVLQQLNAPLADDLQNDLVVTESILCLAAGHMAISIASPFAISSIDEIKNLNQDENGNLKKMQDLSKRLLETSPILSSGRINDRGLIKSSLNSMLNHSNAAEDEDYKKGSEIIDGWQKFVYNELLLFNVDTPLVDIRNRRKGVESKLETYLDSSYFICNGSLSRLCPDQYNKSFKKMAIAIFYHCNNIEFDIECVGKVSRTCRQIMESGIRDALSSSQSSARSRTEICQQRCLLLDSISDFMLEFFCSNDARPLQYILDEFVCIFNTIHSDEELTSIRKLLDSKTEKSIMCYVALRALQFLMTLNGTDEWIQHRFASESIVTAFIKLQNLILSTTMIGCSHDVQTCITSSVKYMSAKFESMIASFHSAEEIDSHCSVFIALYIAMQCHETTLGSYSTITRCCRELAFQEKHVTSIELNLINSMRTYSAQRILQAIIAKIQPVLLNSLQQNNEYSLMTNRDSVLQLIVHEIKETLHIVEKDYKHAISSNEFEDISLDLHICQGIESSESSTLRKQVSIGKAYARYSPLMSTKSTTSSSHGYLNQLLDLVHCVVHDERFSTLSATITKPLLQSLLEILKISIPSSIHLRILRLLRPVLLSTEASSDVIDLLLDIAGIFSRQLVSTTVATDVTMRSDEDLRLSEAAVTTLRCLYTSPNWTRVIHDAIISSSSFFSMCGIMSFLGGLPGCLQPGSFLIIEPDSASSLSSSSSLIAGKTKSALGSIMSTSMGKGVEGILSGLCRQCALAGILYNVEKTGMCEVMVMDSRQGSLRHLDDKKTPCESKVTVRAVRVSSASIACAAELPLYVNNDILGTNILELLLECLNYSASSLIQNDCDATSFKSLFCSAMSIRSMAVLVSNPKVLGHISTNLRKFLSLGLQMAFKLSTQSKDSISKLPAYEAQLWHLLLVKSIVQNKIAKLDKASISMLEELLPKEQPRKQDSASIASSSLSGHQTPAPSSLANTFFDFSSARAASQTSSASNAGREGTASSTREDEDDEESQNAAHLREAAIVQMTELGLPRQWAELALSRTGSIEAAVHFCLERGADMERLIAEETNRGFSTNLNRRRALNSRMNSSHLISQLVDMGFPRHWCVSALSATSNNVDDALTWILTNGDRLAAEAEDRNEDSEDEVDNLEHDGGDSDDASVDVETVTEDVVRNETMEASLKHVETTPIGWHGSMCPIRFVSGKSKINAQTLEIAGLKDGGFSSVGTKGILLTSGKWYYEAEIITAGCLQIGWADSSFAGHCQADRGDGCGDGPSSWAFDGWRRYRWHSNATEWGVRWSEGDIVGCLVDMDNMTISFTLNGKGEEIGMGLAFSDEGFRPCSGVYCCVSFNSREKLRLILGGEGTEPFKYQPDEYRGIGEAILDGVKQRQTMLNEEKAVLSSDETTNLKKSRYICDFSDGEHGHELFSWQHRYHGSDASVHLAGSRSLRGISSSKKLLRSNDGSSKYSSAAHADITTRLRKAFDKKCDSSDTSKNIESAVKLLAASYSQILSDLENELKTICSSLNFLYAQKLVLHLIVSCSSNFTTSLFHGESNLLTSTDDEVSRQLYHVIERTTSISTWLGEAGAMAVAAEALGLGISTYDNNLDSPIAGMYSVTSDQVVLAGGISQFLSSAVLLKNIEARNSGIFTPWTFVAASEAAIGSDSGGAASFIRHGLQSILVSSKAFRRTVLAGVRRAIRVLAVVEFSSEDGVHDDDDTNKKSHCTDLNDSLEYSPDPRLVSFMTGVLLSDSVQRHLPAGERHILICGLFEGWCIGLLSVSSPWRMICATTAAGILNIYPPALAQVKGRVPVIASYLQRLESTVYRRLWAERAAFPICSKYSQAMVELLTSVKRALRECRGIFILNPIRFDAATPLPFTPTSNSICNCWEWDKGWVNCNDGWEVWTGSVEIMAVEWKVPQRSIVRTLMDSGEGPPFLDVGCKVMRGIDWDSIHHSENEDGQDIYEKHKLAKSMEVEAEAVASAQKKCIDENPASDDGTDPAMDEHTSEISSKSAHDSDGKTSGKKKDAPKCKLPVGTVIGIEPCDGIPAMARRVRWHLTGKEGLYRYGGDGGRFDIAHIEVNEKETRIKKKYPLPESMEQIAARYGFGQRRTCNIILRLNRSERNIADTSEITCKGILEWPDFGAGIQVECVIFPDGAIHIEEKQLLYGSKDSGWEARFGGPSYVAGTCTVISPIHEEDSLTSHEVLLGSSSHLIKNLRNLEQAGGRLRVTSEMRLFRAKKGKKWSNKKFDEEYAALYSSPSHPRPICFDTDFHASSMSISRDRMTVNCVSSEGRCTAFGDVGFTRGVHYWEVKIEKAEIGSVFIGVAEKPGTPSGSSQGSSFGFESKPKLNKWLGWGFVNFRATYTAGAERIYGSHCHSGDTVGVMLDCDSGRISYFYDGLKYGEHILNDLGCAFENVSPFGFNADGCGSGGAGQGAPNGIDGVRSSRYPSNGAVRPRALWPVIGLRHPGDRVTFSSKWITSLGVAGVTVQENVLSVDEILCSYNDLSPKLNTPSMNLSSVSFPPWFVEESFLEYKRWQSGRWLRSSTRGSGPCKVSSNGLDVDLDTSPLVCAAACASIGLPFALLPGDKVDVKRSAGRLLELQEEAVILGAYQGRLWYRIISQKSEGGSLMEGGGRAWFWDESEAVEGGLELIGEGKGRSIELPKINRFKPSIGGLKIVYIGGAVVRSDLEIFDGSINIGTIPHGTVIPESNVIERRLNSCGVVRFLINHEPIGRGWISSRIRGGKEEIIVEILPPKDKENKVDKVMNEVSEGITPEDSAIIWHEAYLQSLRNDKESKFLSKKNDFISSFDINTIEEFCELLQAGHIGGMNLIDSDSFIASTYGKISDVLPHTDEVECPFIDCAILLSCSIDGAESEETKELSSSVDSIAHEVALESLMHVQHENLPSVRALLAKISLLRAINRRARYALPWFSLRPAQEESTMFGGLSGFGLSLERAGRLWDTKSNSKWVQVPSTSTRLRKCKNIFFPSIKRFLLDSIMDTTATPTSLSHDEYELPREIRTVRVNRLKARQAITSGDNSLKRKHSVFSQLQREMRGWSGATFRREFVAKGHGGQKRAFKVKLIGEGVNDYSGPYREVFTDAILEVTDIDKQGFSSIGVLEPTANNEAELGDGRDLLIFAKESGNMDTSTINEAYIDQLSSDEKEMLDSFSTLTLVATEQSREVEDSIIFLGKLAGTACRHSIPIDLPLPLGVAWDRIAEEPYAPNRSLLEIDLLAYNRMRDDEYHGVAVSNANATLTCQRRLLNYFVEGMASVLPVEILSIFTGEQLRDILCGNPDIDVELLRRVVEYEGFAENDDVISYLWDVLREMTTFERKLFLQFVWARNRLPLKEADFDAPFRIQKDTKTIKEGEDYPLPSASTCFFCLTLPNYPSKDMLKEKLMFAIENVTTMESDYVTNDVEINEGWRGL